MIEAVRCNTMSEMEGKPGAFCFEANDRGICYNCPCGCEIQGFIPTTGGFTHKWDWDGNRDHPTLSPSIQRTAGCKWHGFLTGGVWKSA